LRQAFPAATRAGAPKDRAWVAEAWVLFGVCRGLARLVEAQNTEVKTEAWSAEVKAETWNVEPAGQGTAVLDLGDGAHAPIDLT
jgi:hypothetical protein